MVVNRDLVVREESRVNRDLVVKEESQANRDLAISEESRANRDLVWIRDRLIVWRVGLPVLTLQI